MTLQSPNDQEPLMALWSDGQLEEIFGYPQNSPTLSTASTADLTTEVSVGYYQEWPALCHGDEASRSLYFDYALPVTTITTALPFYVQLGPQYDPPPCQTPPLGTREHPTIRDSRAHDNPHKRSVRPKVKPTLKPTCCKKEFGRIQEFKRHRREVHEPRHQCPFCTFEWTRPGKIKDHIKSLHRDKFTAKLLGEFEKLRGKEIVGFLSVYYDYGLELETMPNIASLDFPDFTYLS